MSVASRNVADTDVNRIATLPVLVIVGEATDAFAKIENVFQGYSVRTAFLAEKHLLYKLAEIQAARDPSKTAEHATAPDGERRGVRSPDLYLFNLITPFRYDWRDMARRLRIAEPSAGIVLVFDRPTSETTRQAMQAGADEILYEPELSVAALVWRRIGHLIASEEPTAAGKRDVLGIAVPHLRAATGRLDATKIAKRLDVPIARLATVVGVSRQALSQTPDSPGIQAALRPIARMFDVLDSVLSPDDERKWLHATHQRLEGKTPLETVMNGEAEVVARMLESTRASE
jgi:hypothetical protein